MTLRKIGFILCMMSAYPVLGMQQAYKMNPGSSRSIKPSQKALATLKDASRNAALREEAVAVRLPNPREFAVIAIQNSPLDVQKNAVEHLLATPEAREVFLSDIRTKDGAYMVDKLGQIDSLVAHSNKRKLALVADDEERSALEDRIAKSQRLFRVSPSQEGFFFISDEQRVIMARLDKHFDLSVGKIVPISIDLSDKEWCALSGVPRSLRADFRTSEDYFKANLMPTTEDKVAHVAQNVAQHALVGVAPGAFGGWVGQVGNELGTVVLSDQMSNTITHSLGQAAHSTMQDAVKNARQLVLVTPKNEALHQLSQTITTFGGNFPNNAKNDLISTLTQTGPEMIGDAAIKALNSPGNILGSTAMVTCASAGATYGLIKGVTTMNEPLATKNIAQI